MYRILFIISRERGYIMLQMAKYICDILQSINIQNIYNS